MKYKGEEAHTKIIGNLPYYITSDILLSIALKAKNLKKAVFMVQKECYKRIIALKGKDYNALNVLLAYLFDIKEVTIVKKENFFPQPNVESLVFSLTTKNEKNHDFAGFLYKIAKICFINRRKTVFNNLVSTYKNKDEILAILKENTLTNFTRAEEISVEQFVALTSSILKSKTIKI